MKTHLTKEDLRGDSRKNYILVNIDLPSRRTISYKIPNRKVLKDQLTDLLDTLAENDLITPWEEATPWEKIASDLIEKYKKAGLVLRGARLREGMSQKELAKKCGISQENLSKMENGKRVVGEKVARKLAKALHFDYHLLLKN